MLKEQQSPVCDAFSFQISFLTCSWIQAPKLLFKSYKPHVGTTAGSLFLHYSSFCFFSPFPDYIAKIDLSKDKLVFMNLPIAIQICLFFFYIFTPFHKTMMQTEFFFLVFLTENSYVVWILSNIWYGRTWISHCTTTKMQTVSVLLS